MGKKSGYTGEDDPSLPWWKRANNKAQRASCYRNWCPGCYYCDDDYDEEDDDEDDDDD